MAKMAYITGMNKVIANMKRANNLTGAAVAKGLKDGGLFLERESQKIVPVEIGVLRNSANTRNMGSKDFKADIVVSYSTEYAVYVHENMQASHKTGKEAKYLEKPAKQKKREIIRIIRRSAQRGLFR